MNANATIKKSIYKQKIFEIGCVKKGSFNKNIVERNICKYTIQNRKVAICNR